MLAYSQFFDIGQSISASATLLKQLEFRVKENSILLNKSGGKKLWEQLVFIFTMIDFSAKATNGTFPEDFFFY